MARPQLVKADQDPDAPKRVTVNVRSKDYTLVEVDGDKYDAAETLAETDRKDPNGFPILDMSILTRQLLVDSIEPRMTMKELNARPVGVRTELLGATADLYFPANSELMARTLRARGWEVKEPQGAKTAD